MSKAMVLFSGGVDSTTCLGLAIEKYGKENVIALSISYGQKHKKEVEAARSIAAYYGIELLSLDLQKIFTYSDCSLLEQSDAEVPKESYAEQLKETSGKPETGESVSQLGQWPCQIKLVPVHAPYFQGAKLLIAADCTAFSYANLHREFMKGKITLIGCPKLDSVDYSEKLTQILSDNDIRSLTIVRMEVPCCGGLEMAAKKALQASGKFIPWQVVTISTDGRILD